MGDNGNVAPDGKQATGLAAYSVGEMITFVASAVPKDIPEIEFVTDDGTATSLDAWRGKVVLLNLWATWCGPCRKEMPTLDRLKAELGGAEFDVVALSVDRGGLEKPRKFLQEIKVRHLKLYNNSSGKVTSALKVIGMPTTLLINAQGQQIGRLVGPAEWDSKDALALIGAAIAAGK
ncbi:MAG: TlpA family protein disulfide reductase [Proteobacteria bacterium]|nr:TlpA family protein disulfide reductase [Pseudomonadota bacterium]